MAKIGQLTERVGKATLFEDLEQESEHAVVGLFDLVEKQHRKGLRPDRFGQQALRPEAVANQPGYGIRVGVFAHIKTQQTPRIAIKPGSQGFGELGFAGAGRATEKQDRVGPPWIGESGFEGT